MRACIEKTRIKCGQDTDGDWGAGKKKEKKTEKKVVG